MKQPTLIEKLQAALTTFTQRGEVLVIDYSGYCGPVDYALLDRHVHGDALPHVDGVIFRVTDGTRIDAQAIANINGCMRYGIPFGVYGTHYPRASASSNKAQGQALANFVLGLGEYPVLGVYGDEEVNPDKLGIAAYRMAVNKYFDTYENALNERLDDYTSAGKWDAWFANATNGNTDFPKAHRLWVASWYGSRPTIPYDWAKRYSSGFNQWILWQYDNRLRVQGINASVDANTFNGSRADFAGYFGVGVTPPPPPPPPAFVPHMAVVNTTAVNIRAGASAESEDIGTLRIDSDFIADAESDDGKWLHFSGGWVHRAELDE